MISTLIPTLDEEANLPRCLAALGWCDDVVVLDSGSSDATIDIARRAGATVVERPFDDWATHLTWAARNIPFKHPWVLHIDADEVVTPELQAELASVAASGPADIVAYRLRYRNYFLGRWIRHCGIYPIWLMRFFQPAKVRWERSVHQVAIVEGREGRLRSHFDHFSFNKGFEAWIEKHNRYSSREAEVALDDLAGEGVPLLAILQRDPVARRAALKRLSFRMPFRPTLRFFYMYVLRLGFLDGSAGLTYCRLLAYYEWLIVLKMREQRRRARGLPL